MKIKLKIKDFNVFFGSFLFSLLIAEMVSGLLFNFYVIRFLQAFIIINFLCGGIKWLFRFWIFAIPAIILIAFGITYPDNNIIIGDIFNIIWWVIFILILNYSIDNEFSFQIFLKILFHSTFFIVSILAIFGLIKLYLSTLGIIFPQFMVLREDGIEYPLLGTSLNKDYNIFSFGIFCGVFAGLYCYSNTSKVHLKVFYSFMILMSLISAILSMSRRGFVLGIFLFVLVIIWSFKKYSNKYNKNGLSQNKTANKPWLFVVASTIIVLFAISLDWNSVLFDYTEINTWLSRIETITSIDSNDNDTRGIRWIFSMEYFSKLSFVEKICGNGFEYMSIFGVKFQETDFDHPHNVWISSLLYGGILGFLSTTGLTLIVLFQYFNRRDLFQSLFYWYLLFLFLNFTSANTIFSSRVFVVLLLIPFLSFTRKSHRLSI
jgi:hypothetical protein